ncbi:MAG TPA: hypothetical protein VG520_01755 [Candidatus Dormibacteraeota bacterium]|jgi:hypothetical protein|nr:hypothetical protein [Candidatus Dormibacteraeota bacterium]
MADAGGMGRVQVIAELLFIRRLPTVLRVLVPLLLIAACVVLGVESLAIQHHYAGSTGGGRVAALLAQGSTAATAWEGWAAALFFLVALLRLRRGAPEPPAGRTPIEDLSAAQMRAGLLREYTVVRVGLTVLVAVAVTDAARAARYLMAAASGDALARGSLLATVVEAAGVVVAAAILGMWAGSFRGQLERVGAVR